MSKPNLRLLRSSALILGLCALTVSRAKADVIHDYEFNNSLSDSLGGPNLTSLGGTIGPTSYLFGVEQGLSLSGALTAAQSSTYTIDLSFELDSLGGFRKLLDFKNLASDNGLYNLNTAMNYFNITTGPTGAFTPGVFVRVDLTRDNSTGLVVGYVNGVQQISFTDSTSDAVFNAASNIINFFQDDNVTGGRESSSGSVNQIRIYNTALSATDVAALGGPKPIAAVPEPSSLTLLATGVAATVLAAGARRFGPGRRNDKAGAP
jgi:Concanavalin A-like lectin/glucanases superfamily/PEP-CTERM motif